MVKNNTGEDAVASDRSELEDYLSAHRNQNNSRETLDMLGHDFLEEIASTKRPLDAKALDVITELIKTRALSDDSLTTENLPEKGLRNSLNTIRTLATDCRVAKMPFILGPRDLEVLARSGAAMIRLSREYSDLDSAVLEELVQAYLDELAAENTFEIKREQEVLDGYVREFVSHQNFSSYISVVEQRYRVEIARHASGQITLDELYHSESAYHYMVALINSCKEENINLREESLNEQFEQKIAHIKEDSQNYIPAELARVIRQTLPVLVNHKTLGYIKDEDLAHMLCGMAHLI